MTESTNSFNYVFPYPELTKLPTDEKLTISHRTTLHLEINSNAMVMPSSRGGGRHGHLAIVVSAGEYISPEIAGPLHPFVVPPNPGAYVPPAGTAAQIAEARRLHDIAEKEFNRYIDAKNRLRSQLIAAIPIKYIKRLQQRRFGFSTVGPLAILALLDDTYGTVTRKELAENLANVDREWSIDQPIEDLWNQFATGQEFAADHDPISDQYLIRQGIATFTNTGVFDLDIREWDRLPPAQQTYNEFKAFFTNANIERLSKITTTDAGYAAKVEELGDKRQNTAADENEGHYCWTHGCNYTHPGSTCNRKAPGHNDKATLANIMGGNNTIQRKRGQPGIFQRRKRRIDDENTEPAADA